MALDRPLRLVSSARFRMLLLLPPLSLLVADSRADDPKTPAREVRKVDVGGYALSLATQGKGGPTIVIEPGGGHAAVEGEEWRAVCDELAKTNLVCLYDRAGLGSSDPAPTKPRTSRDFARDLHTLLKNAGIPAPYVLVAHSIGGLNARMFAAMYPDEVAGVVLVDVAVPGQDAKWLAALPAEAAGEEESVTRARQFLTARLADRGRNRDGMDVTASGNEVAAARDLGVKPLAVLTHSPDWKMAPDLKTDVWERLERISQGLQAELPRLSTDSSHKVAQKAGHALHVEEPQMVIDAVREVVGKWKARPEK